MLTLTRSHVRLGQAAGSKAEAIRIVGQTMVEAGFIEPGYIDSMLRREGVSATYLGNGIAIPHGTPDARELVRATGVVVVQFPRGVDWGKDGQARVVVGIAARSDEHLQVLANLTGVLGDAVKAEELARTTDPGVIVVALNGASAAPEPAAELPPITGPSIQVTSPVPHGLHARPATALVEVAKRFRANITVQSGRKTANAKSLVTLLSLGAVGGSSLTITATGDDAQAALTALRAAFEAGLDEEVAAPPRAAPAAPAPAPAARLDYDGPLVVGISASPGIATGPVWAIQHERLEVKERAPDPAREHQRLDQALAGATAELHNLYQEFLKKAGAARAAIFKAHQELLDDPDMVSEAHRRVDTGASAGWAWRDVYEERAGVLAGLPDPLLAARAGDLRDVGRRVLRLLADVVEGAASLPDHPVVLLAEDLAPSDTAKLDPAMVLGLCTVGGGATSHTAIIARSLDIPAVVAAGPSVLDVPNGRQCILDGEAGVLVARPSEKDLERAASRRERARGQRETEKLERYKPAITRDGHRVEVAANIGSASDAEKAVNAGGEGVGLMRTEFLFLQREDPPGEEEQYEAYRKMVRALNGLPIILRTLDIGGDKQVPYLSLPAEANPFLGVRGIRLCFEREDLFRTQLRAILRASLEGPVRIMYPMVATLAEVRRARAITDEVRREVGAGPVETGIMIEVPSAVLLADQLAREVSFFSIGTNDLTQYTLAMDREHPVLAPQADGVHPAVLRMVDLTVKAARNAGIWVGACGGVAGDPAGALTLTGLGVTELSVAIPTIPSIKALLRSVSLTDAEALARRALACADAAEVRALVRGMLSRTGEGA
ncbi:phosphoenolpyruvate--protein phosphotransferase [Pyxidicoccus fallax]|uniref:phosphoenolpyruvate--protein phosphotransferase n=1 Tax=Pyxidicoccus fallax TaxID=394095 RepID=A0A848LFI5_9BACT|nr:phosphoenolpyruvate--protein phosphotransferase [Pyxidicoccus fallax]NMO14338.1 phosphoenolpyruvate--protein phosphotransferase [Pyxidicoccus fallax]NPC82473.1 phosphoenolpyruvate--protein phosphotransferase [Pyxidicoccus fallax]